MLVCLYQVLYYALCWLFSCSKEAKILPRRIITSSTESFFYEKTSRRIPNGASCMMTLLTVLPATMALPVCMYCHQSINPSFFSQMVAASWLHTVTLHSIHGAGFGKLHMGKGRRSEGREMIICDSLVGTPVPLKPAVLLPF